MDDFAGSGIDEYGLAMGSYHEREFDVGGSVGRKMGVLG